MGKFKQILVDRSVVHRDSVYLIVISKKNWEISSTAAYIL